MRRVAIEVLRAVGGAGALGDLRSLLADPDPNVQREALRAIIQIGSDEAYTILEEALTSGEPRAREAVMHTLGAITDERAAPLLVHILSTRPIPAPGSRSTSRPSTRWDEAAPARGASRP